MAARFFVEHEFMHHRSFGLSILVNDIVRPESKILDLGPLASGTTEAFLKLHCQCYVEDLIEYLSEAQDQTDSHALLAEHLLAKPEELKFDVILAWDILNFLSLDIIEYLFQLLAPHLKAGTILHVMQYTNREPRRPKRFRLTSDFCYDYVEDASYPQIDSQPHSTLQLLKRLKRFTISNTLMARQGMDKNLTEHFLEFDRQSTQQRIQSEGVQAEGFQDTAPADSITLQGLGKIFDGLDKSHNVMDCGKKIGRNLDAISRKVGNLMIEDVYASLTWYKKIHGEASLAGFKGMIHKLNTSVDLVLLWDLLNFLTKDQVIELIDELASIMSVGGQLHMIISKGTGVAEKPANFEIIDREKVNFRGTLTGEQTSLLTSISDVMKLMPQFKLARHNFGRASNDEAFQELVMEKTLT